MLLPMNVGVSPRSDQQNVSFYVKNIRVSRVRSGKKLGAHSKHIYSNLGSHSMVWCDCTLKQLRDCHAADAGDSSSFFDDPASQIPQSPGAKGASPAPSPRSPAPGGLHLKMAEAQPGTAKASILHAFYAAS